jgi:hypothetical protein
LGSGGGRERTGFGACRAGISAHLVSGATGILSGAACDVAIERAIAEPIAAAVEGVALGRGG